MYFWHFNLKGGKLRIYLQVGLFYGSTYSISLMMPANSAE